MTADTFSNTLGFLSMVTGNDPNTWGVNCNNNVFQIFEDAIAGVLTSTVTGGTLDLSGSPPPAAASQARYARLVFTGTLAADQTVIVPSLSKIWFVENQTSGAFVLLFKTPFGTATQIPQGSTKIVYYDSLLGITRLDSNEIGEIKAQAAPTLQGGFLACDGAAYKRTRYPDLFARIGTVWGLGSGGDATTFGVPLLTDTGRYLRSTGPDTVGTYRSNQNLSHSHTGTATGTTDATGTDHTHAQSGSFTSGNNSVDHTHGPGPGQTAFIGGSGIVSGFFSTTSSNQNYSQVAQTGVSGTAHTHLVTISGQTGGMSANHTHTFTSGAFTTGLSGGTEARPESAVVLMCIRY